MGQRVLQGPQRPVLACETWQKQHKDPVSQSHHARLGGGSTGPQAQSQQAGGAWGLILVNRGGAGSWGSILVHGAKSLRTTALEQELCAVQDTIKPPGITSQPPEEGINLLGKASERLNGAQSTQDTDFLQLHLSIFSKQNNLFH